ncbi:hypothetical protein V6N13_075889 [Hibiscus sabdariffa]|uniref:Uncharacterized protein n=1 Tax=Hibiscus sabdariffa TaxID=183260 RepID=A0ABR2UCY8_9ROSI
MAISYKKLLSGAAMAKYNYMINIRHIKRCNDDGVWVCGNESTLVFGLRTPSAVGGFADGIVELQMEIGGLKTPSITPLLHRGLLSFEGFHVFNLSKPSENSKRIVSPPSEHPTLTITIE